MSNLMSPLVWCGPAAAAFDPATLSLDGYYRASFSGSPWTPTASAGSSGSSGNFAEATNPPSTGTAVNGFTPATFDGSNDILVNANETSLLSSTDTTIIVLAKASASTAAATDFYDDPPLLATQGGNHALAFTSSGVRCGVWDTAARQTAHIAQGTGAWFMAAGRIDKSGSGTVKCRVCSAGSTTDATPVSIPGTPAGLGTDVFLGKNYNAAKFFAGDILEVITVKSVLTDADLVNIKLGFNSRYGLSL